MILKLWSMFPLNKLSLLIHSKVTISLWLAVLSSCPQRTASVHPLHQLIMLSFKPSCHCPFKPLSSPACIAAHSKPHNCTFILQHLNIYLVQNIEARLLQAKNKTRKLLRWWKKRLYSCWWTLARMMRKTFVFVAVTAGLKKEKQMPTGFFIFIFGVWRGVLVAKAQTGCWQLQRFNYKKYKK